MNSIGLAERSWFQARQPSHPRGARHSKKTGIFSQRFRSMRSVIDLEVHAVVEARDLLAVAVEHQGLALAEFAEPALAGLAPAGMIYRRVDVGVEAVFARIGDIPGAARHPALQFDFDDAFDALEAVLPRDDDPHR